MKTTIKEITPQWAANQLETHNPHNRNLSEKFIDKLIRDIHAKAFLLTHQGLAFDENGDLIDGQHRLEAIKRSGVTVKMMVTTGLPATQRANGISLKTFEVIDSGRTRTVGQMLKLNGWASGNNVAATVRSLANWIYSADAWIQLSTAQTEKILNKCGDSVAWSARSTAAAIVKANAWARAPLAFFHTVNPAEAEDFAAKFASLENLKRNHPSFALSTWLRHHPRNNSLDTAKVACSAICKFQKGLTAEKLYSNEEASKELLAQNKTLASFIHSVIHI